MAENAATKEAPKMGNSKMWIGGLVVVIVILLGVNFMYMKQIRDAKAREAAAKSNSGSMGMGEPYLDAKAPVNATTNSKADEFTQQKDVVATK